MIARLLWRHQRARYTSPDELATALGERFAPMPYLGTVMGLRWGEVAALRVRSIDFLRRSITVTEGLSRDGRPNAHRPSEVRSQPTSPSGAQALLDFLAAHIAAHGLTGRPDAFLFSQATASLD